LDASSSYEYRVGDGTIMSEWIPFKTLPSSDTLQSWDDTQSINFAIIGDMGYGNNSNVTVANLISLVDSGDIDVVIHTGDISYADGIFYVSIY
jgi:phosphodiesterase/alkaline phosphatase D-like protein